MGSKPCRSDVSAAVGARVRKLREARGLSLADLSPLVGIHINQLSQLERGRRRVSVDDLLAFAEAFDVAAGALLEEPQLGYWLRRADEVMAEPTYRELLAYQLREAEVVPA